jgi:hypothetical protein
VSRALGSRDRKYLAEAIENLITGKLIKIELNNDGGKIVIKV